MEADDSRPITMTFHRCIQTRCSITVDQVSIKSDRLVGHRCAETFRIADPADRVAGRV